MQKKVIILDLDDTLLNTNEIRSSILKLAQGVGVNKKKALEARISVRSSSKPFTIENYASFLFPNSSVERQKLKLSFNKMFQKKGSFNYPGVEAFLKNLSKKYSLILLTYGDNTLQKKKIVQSGFSRYFSKIIVSSDNTKAEPMKGLMKIHSKDVLFIDNAKATCDTASKLGMPMIWVTSKNKNSKYFKRLAERIETRF